MVFNDIFPGFAWTQQFDFAAGVLAPGSGVRADFKANIAAPVLLSISDGDGLVVAGDSVTVALSPAQTALLEPAAAEVCFDFIRTPDETHLGVRVFVPLNDSITGPV
jgi:hypothetical protein